MTPFKTVISSILLYYYNIHHHQNIEQLVRSKISVILP